jgi:thiol-disulfide isomerase/thioredoxin
MTTVTAYHFWSPTCAPCKVIKPAVEDLKEEFDTVRWISVNTHNDSDDLSKTYNVNVVPTIVVVARDAAGTELYKEKHSGTTMAHYYRIIRNAQRFTLQSSA